MHRGVSIMEKDTKELIHEFLDPWFQHSSCLDKSGIAARKFCGTNYQQAVIDDLPTNVDPCGENGGFHTYVFHGPIFKKPAPIEIGERVFREYKSPVNSTNTSFANQPTTPCSMGFWFCDLLPG